MKTVTKLKRSIKQDKKNGMTKKEIYLKYMDLKNMNKEVGIAFTETDLDLVYASIACD